MENIAKNKPKMILLSAFSVILILTISCMVYVGYGINIRKNHVLAHLESKGYASAEIQKIEVKHSFFHELSYHDKWSITVVFKDEPNATYEYQYKSKTEIVQTGGFAWGMDALKHTGSLS